MTDKPNTREPSKTRRRRFQFRLRTLLIVVALTATLLAAWRWYGTILRLKDREAVRQALEDGRLKSDPYAPDDPVR